jgi:hypothetical protein
MIQEDREDEQSRMIRESKHLECIINVKARFGRRFEEQQIPILSKTLRLSCRNFPQSRKVTFVSNEQFGDRIRNGFVNLCQPRNKTSERLLGCGIIYNDNPMLKKRRQWDKMERKKRTNGATIIRRCNSPESILASRVPNLKLNLLAVNFYGTKFLQTK